MTRFVLLISLMTAFIAGPALADPYLVVDGAPTSLMLIDEASMVRTGDIVEVDILAFMTGRPPVISRVAFGCEASTWREEQQRIVNRDLTFKAPTSVMPTPQPLATDSLLYSVHALICRQVQRNETAGFSIPTLADSITYATKLIGEEPAWM